MSFGIKGRWVYARYCDKGGEIVPDKAKNKANLAQDCIQDGVDVCFQKAALQAHNEYRARHRGGRPLAPDRAASAYIQ